MSSRAGRASACLVVLVALVAAGCTSGPLSPEPANASADGTAPGEAAGNGTPASVWRVSQTQQPEMAGGSGLAFRLTAAVLAVNTSLAVEVPADATRLSANLTPQPDDGIGDMTVSLAGPNGTVVLPEDTDAYGIYQGEGAVHVAVDDPKPGDWVAKIWPHGVVADQTWTLTVAVQGNGTAPNGTVFP